MVTKTEMSEKLNELLGLEEPIGFEKLTKTELERLLEVFSTVAQVAEIGIRTAKNRFGGGLLREPVGEILNAPLIDVLSSVRREGGLIGLLGKALGQRTRRTKKRESKAE